MAHSPPIPIPASRRNTASCQTFVTKALRNVNTEYQTMVSISVRTRPNLSDGPPEESESPAAEKQSEKQSTVIADVAFCGSDARTREQFSQRGHEHQGIDERVHAIERPASPGSPEAANLISRERRRADGFCFDVNPRSGHDSGDYIKSG